MAVLAATGTLASGTGNVTPTIPAGAQAGDIMVLLIETANEAVANDATLVSNGWAHISPSPQGTGTAAGTAATRLTAYWKRHSGSESNPALGDAGNHTGGIILCYRWAVPSGNPIAASAGDTGASSTSVTIPGVTTTEDDCLVVACVAWATDNAGARASGWANGNLADLVEVHDAGTTQGNGGGIGVANGVKATAGATGATTCTLAGASVQARIQFALLPDPDAPTEVTLTATSSSNNWRSGSSWPPENHVGNEDGNDTFFVNHEKDGSTFLAANGYLRFDGSSLPGGTVTAATLRLYVGNFYQSKMDADNMSLAGEFFDYGGSTDSSDYAANVTTPCFTAIDITGITVGAYLEIPLTDLTGITSGNFGFRLTFVPPGAPAGFNQLGFHGVPNATGKPQLVVSYAGDDDDGTDVGVSVEVDQAHPVSRSRVRQAITATETGAVPPAGRGRVWTVGAASDTATARPAGRERRHPLTPAAETGQSHTVGRARSHPTGAPAEDGAAAALSRARIRDVGHAQEADAAHPAGQARARAASAATETDVALPAGRGRTHDLDAAQETDTALPLGTVHVTVLGVASEVDTIQPASRARSNAVGVTMEVDTALPLGLVHVTVLGVASDTSMAHPAGRARSHTTGPATDTGTPHPLGRHRNTALRAATETVAALTLTQVRTRYVGVAVEVSQAFPLVPVGFLPPGTLAVTVHAHPAVAADLHAHPAVAALVHARPAIRGDITHD